MGDDFRSKRASGLLSMAAGTGILGNSGSVPVGTTPFMARKIGNKKINLTLQALHLKMLFPNSSLCVQPIAWYGKGIYCPRHSASDKR